jgi:hypothetical protein
MTNKEHIKELRNWAKENLVGRTVYHSAFLEGIVFTNSGIKEYLNQPHKHYHEKNEMIKDIAAVLQKSPIIADAPDKSGNTNLHFYYLATQVNGMDSYLVVRLTKHNNKCALYSIVDAIKKQAEPTTKDLQSNTESLPEN